MDLSIVIVTWNVRELLLRCLRSIEETKNALVVEIIVVDNASHDGTVDAVRQHFPQVRVIALASNTGFAKANNEGIRVAQGRYVLILNPDTIVKPYALLNMMGHLDGHPEVSLVAPRINNIDGTFQAGSQRTDPRLFVQLVILLKMQPLLRNARAFRDYYRDDFDPSKEQECIQPLGAALCVRRTTLEKLSNFDERFFIWFEEIDLCSRLRASGGRCWYVPSAVIEHVGGASFSQRLPIIKQCHYAASAFRYFAKNKSAASAAVIALVAPLSIFLTIAQQLVGIHGSVRR